MGETYHLTNEDIALARERTEEFLTDIKADRMDVVRLGLMLEEILLQYRDCFGMEQPFVLKYEKRLWKSQISILLTGLSYNPFEDEIGELKMLRKLQSGSDIGAQWLYKNGVNNIIFVPRKKIKLSFPARTILAVLLAVIAGLLCGNLDEGIRTGFMEGFISPTLGMLMGIISAVSGPMIFFSLVWGICTIGDTNTLSSIGKKMITRFMLQLILASTFAAVFCYPFFSGASGSNMAFRISEFYQMLLGIIPNNMIAPFVTGNMQQIIFLAIILGIVLLLMGNRVSAVTSLVEHFTIVIQTIMTMANVLIPFIVFLSILKVILNHQFSASPQTYKVIPVYIGFSILIILLYSLVTAFRQKVNPVLLMKKSWPAFLLALTTGSSPTVLATNLDICENEFGIDNRIVRFGVPLGQTIFKPGSLTRFVVVAFCMAEIYGIAITPNWFALVIITCFLMGVSSPPVAGGAVVCYTVLFSQLGIPEEALGFALAVNVIFDFVLTAVNIYCLQMELIGLSGSLNMLDREKLRRR